MARKSRSVSPPAVTKAALYLRVSTGRQAEQDLSIPDQKAQTRAWAAQRGWAVVAEYVEPGASATDDKRPEFQRMIERMRGSANLRMSTDEIMALTRGEEDGTILV